MSTVENYLEFWLMLDETARMEFTAEALAVVEKEGLDMSGPEEWDTLGWVFADTARNHPDTDKAVTGVGMAAAMFAMAESLRNPPRQS